MLKLERKRDSWKAMDGSGISIQGEETPIYIDAIKLGGDLMPTPSVKAIAVDELDFVKAIPPQKSRKSGATYSIYEWNRFGHLCMVFAISEKGQSDFYAIEQEGFRDSFMYMVAMMTPDVLRDVILAIVGSYHEGKEEANRICEIL